MKKIFLVVLGCCAMALSHSQKIVKEHYTVSGGVLGAANFTKFSDKNPAGVEYDFRPGWSIGGWVNFPISNAFSIEPQLVYSSYRYRTNSTTQALINDGTVRYMTVPVSLKFHTGDKFAIIAGPEVDFVNSVEPGSGAVKSDFKSPSFSGFAGFELFPHSVVSIYGRYIHGFTSMADGQGETNGKDYHNQNIQAGLKIKLFGKKIPADSDGDGVSDPKDKCPNVAGVARYDGCPIPDTDGDGINDEEDKCPNEPGTLKYNGCPIPDSDKDGINDEQDKCPNQPGTAKYQGCPIPDSDGDGVNDEEDKCPQQAGPASRNGCPVTDRDNDGINDDEDKCPDLAGVAANNGCPDVPANVSKTLMASGAGIAFGTGASNAKLMSKSYTSLNKVVTIMKENPSLKVRIEGHTDNAGNDDANMTLSQKRADAVKAYLVSKGISEDRITAEGFGESNPIADNGTAAGRATNRRIEIKIAY